MFTQILNLSLHLQSLLHLAHNLIRHLQSLRPRQGNDRDLRRTEPSDLLHRQVILVGVHVHPTLRWAVPRTFNQLVTFSGNRVDWEIMCHHICQLLWELALLDCIFVGTGPWSEEITTRTTKQQLQFQIGVVYYENYLIEVHEYTDTAKNVQFALSICICICLVVLFFVNRRLTLNSRHRSKLTVRYQLAENVKALRYRFPKVPLNPDSFQNIRSIRCTRQLSLHNVRLLHDILQCRLQPRRRSLSGDTRIHIFFRCFSDCNSPR